MVLVARLISCFSSTRSCWWLRYTLSFRKPHKKKKSSVLSPENELSSSALSSLKSRNLEKRFATCWVFFSLYAAVLHPAETMLAADPLFFPQGGEKLPENWSVDDFINCHSFPSIAFKENWTHYHATAHWSPCHDSGGRSVTMSVVIESHRSLTVCSTALVGQKGATSQIKMDLTLIHFSSSQMTHFENGRRLAATRTASLGQHTVLILKRVYCVPIVYFFIRLFVSVRQFLLH